VEVVFTPTDSEIEMRAMTVIREMALSVHVLRAEQVVYADEVEGKMDEAIWKRKIVFRKELVSKRRSGR
jgi:hypothetical protein